MGLKWSFISYPPRNCVMKAIKSASGYDLKISDVDSSSKKSWWRKSGCQPLSHHDFIRPMSPCFYSNPPFYRGASHGLGGYGLAVGCFISANCTGRWTNRQGGSKGQVCIKPEAYSVAGLAGLAGLEPRSVWPMDLA